MDNPPVSHAPPVAEARRPHYLHVALRMSFFAAREEKQILRFAQDDMSF